LKWLPKHQYKNSATTYLLNQELTCLYKTDKDSANIIWSPF